MIQKGQKINDRYQIIRSIGEGGMANVYLAHDTVLDRYVAVKVLRGDLAQDEKFVRRFQREAISASSLSHPNIVEMYDVGEDDGNYFIVMEFVEGKTLKNLIKKRGALTIEEVVDIMVQLTSAISCAHDSYIIHRDIKPQNVMIPDDGRVKVMDFGIAIASNASELTQTNSVMGSVHYLPPEQANGHGATIKSDIYSLGILMYEILTGKLPFKGDNAVEIALKQMKDKIPSVCKLNPEIPQAVENVILKACAKNPKNRYESVKDMYVDLKSVLDDNRKNEEKIVYLYPEDELEETKTLAELKDMKKDNKPSNDKKINVALIIGIVLVTLITFGTIFFVTIMPKITAGKDVKVPDVTGLSVEDAEAELMKVGFKIDIEILEESSDTIKEGKVIKTSPSANRTVKLSQKIKITISTGTAKILIEDYTGKNALEVKGALEILGLEVLIEKKKVEEDEKDPDKYDASLVIEQSLKEDTKVEKGTQITLYVPDVIVKYPDFTTGFTFKQIEDWAKENNVYVTRVDVETDEYPEGTIISQERPAGSSVADGVTFRVNVAIKKPKEDLKKPTDDD